MRQAKRIERAVSDEEWSRLHRLREQIEAEKDEIIADARGHKAAHDAVVARLRKPTPRRQSRVRRESTG